MNIHDTLPPITTDEIWGVGCECWVVNERYWFSYGGAVEPGSQIEFNPDCPMHGDGDATVGAYYYGNRTTTRFPRWRIHKVGKIWSVWRLSYVHLLYEHPHCEKVEDFKSFSELISSFRQSPQHYAKLALESYTDLKEWWVNDERQSI